MKKIIRFIAAFVILGLGAVFFRAEGVSAAGVGITVSPMYQKIIVNPGESQKFSFKISNPADSTETVEYELSVEPFYMSESNEIMYEAEGKSGEITDWVEFDSPTEGSIKPNGVTEVIFTIEVPETAPAGGQYFTVMVTKKNKGDTGETGETEEGGRQTMIDETYRMAHLVYAEVTGDVRRSAEIFDVSVPSFLLSGNITGSASVKNTGNVHGDASYTLQVFPLFSDEEVYTNEEDPETTIILPGRTRYHETSWEGTPGVGIFNVVYTVQFGDSMEQVSKMVIVCPLWLLFIIVFVIAAIIIWLVMKARARRK